MAGITLAMFQRQPEDEDLAGGEYIGGGQLVFPARGRVRRLLRQGV